MIKRNWRKFFRPPSDKNKLLFSVKNCGSPRSILEYCLDKSLQASGVKSKRDKLVFTPDSKKRLRENVVYPRLMCGWDMWSKFRVLAFEFPRENSIKMWHTYCRQPQQISLLPSTHVNMFGQYWPSSGIYIHYV